MVKISRGKAAFIAIIVAFSLLFVGLLAYFTSFQELHHIQCKNDCRKLGYDFYNCRYDGIFDMEGECWCKQSDGDLIQIWHPPRHHPVSHNPKRL